MVASTFLCYSDLTTKKETRNLCKHYLEMRFQLQAEARSVGLDLDIFYSVHILTRPT